MEDASKTVSPEQLEAIKTQLLVILNSHGIQLEVDIVPFTPSRLTGHKRATKNKRIFEAGRKFLKTNTTGKKKNQDLVPFFKQWPLFGGHIVPENIVLMPKELSSFLKQLFLEFTTKEYVPVLLTNKKIIRTDYFPEKDKSSKIDFKQGKHLTNPEEKKFFDRLFSQQKSVSVLSRGLSPKEFSQMRDEYLLPAGLRIIRIDPDGGYFCDNMLLVCSVYAKKVISMFMNASPSLMQDIKETGAFFKKPDSPKPPHRTNLFVLHATFKRKSLEDELGITREQAAAISLPNFFTTKVNDPSQDKTTLRWQKYQRSGKTLELVSEPSSTVNHLTMAEANTLLNKMWYDERFVRTIRLGDLPTIEQSGKSRDCYEKMSAFFTRMCAVSKEERAKLKNMGLSDLEISLMKVGYRLNTTYHNGISHKGRREEFRTGLNIHHIIPRSFGSNYQLVKADGSLEPRYAAPHRKGNLILMDMWLHSLYHSEYLDPQITKAKGLAKEMTLKIIDFSLFGHVFDHIALMKEYGMEKHPVQEFSTFPQVLEWRIVDRQKGQKER